MVNCMCNRMGCVSKVSSLSIQTDQGIKNLTVEEADRLAASNPDYAIGDLFNAIANGNFPSWSFFSQVMTFEQAVKFRFNPFDLTKVKGCFYIQECL